MPHVNSRDGVRLHYAVHDYTDPWTRPRTLILHHGYGRTGYFWFPVIPYLARFYRIVCPDLRGMGDSREGVDIDTGYTPEKIIADVLSIADDVGAADFHYAGESTGGTFGMLLAALHPERVRTLCTMSSPFRIEPSVRETIFKFGYATREEALEKLGPKGWSEAAGKAIRFPPHADPAMAAWYADEMGKADLKVLMAIQKMNRSVDLEPYLSRIAAPMLGLYPTNATMTPESQQQTMRRLIPRLQLVHLPNEYHHIMAMAPATCAMHLLHFIAAHDGVPCRDA